MTGIESLTEHEKRIIDMIGPNYLKPKEVAYYKLMNDRKKKGKKRNTKANAVKLPDEYRANCPNIDCLSSVDAEDTQEDELRFTCFKCGCEWVMSREFAFRVTNY